MATTRGVITSLVVVGGICAALYPIGVVPLLESKRRSKENPPAAQQPGFQKGSLWKELEKRN